MILLHRLLLSAALTAVTALSQTQPSDTGPQYVFGEKVVHLDLKGAPLSISYMKRIFPLLREMGATGLLVEYEDMFPYSGELANLSALNHYSVEDIHRLLAAARSHNLTVMPLIQTFGHLEFSLKLEEHIGLREEPTNPQALCPSLNSSMQMIHEMIRQVSDLHRGHSSHLHIGCDEVFAIGRCPRCQRRMEIEQWTTDDLFLHHVLSVATAVKEVGMQPVMWDDMLRKIDLEKLTQYKALTSIIELMVWHYTDVLPQDVLLAMDKYTNLHLPGVWAASAFKGATNPTYQLPAYESRLDNHIAWAAVVKIFEDRLHVKGIALTGWQRFDHFTPLCQLFPASVPVLALCLAYLDTGSYDHKVLADIQELLKCNRPIPLHNPKRPLLVCNYPGSGVLVAVQHYDQILKKRQLTEARNTYKATMSAMNRNHNFSSPSTLRSAISDLQAMERLVESVRTNLEALPTCTDEATLLEWIETYLTPEIQWIESAQQAADAMLNRTTWPRRPLYDEL